MVALSSSRRAASLPLWQLLLWLFSRPLSADSRISSPIWLMMETSKSYRCSVCSQEQCPLRFCRPTRGDGSDRSIFILYRIGIFHRTDFSGTDASASWVSSSKVQPVPFMKALLSPELSLVVLKESSIPLVSSARRLTVSGVDVPSQGGSPCGFRPLHFSRFFLR